MKKQKYFLVLLIFSLIFSSGYAFAADDKDDSGEVFELGEIVVSGRSEVISRVATVQTIDSEEIELNDSDNVAEALDNMVGLTVSTGTKNEGNLNVRGFNQRYVPIFYDGIPWYIPYDGYVDPSEISTGNVSRITLTKGAPSSLYGANTMGGVINIVSRKPTEAFEGSLDLSITKDQYRASLNLGSLIGKFYFMGGLSGMDFDNYRMSDDYSPVPESAEDGHYRENSDRKSLTKSLKIGFMPAKGHEYAIGFHSTKSEKGWAPNVYPDQSVRYWRFPEWEKSTYYFVGNTRITDGLSAKVRIYHDEYYNVLDAFKDSTQTSTKFHSTYDDYTNGASFVLRTDYINNNILSFSYHYKDDIHREQFKPGLPWENYETKTYSYGLEDSISITDNIGLVAGLNYDVQEPIFANGGALRDDDDALNGVVGVTVSLSPDAELHVSAAKKTRFPTQKELYSSYLDDDRLANPNLKKEQSYNYEIGISSAVPLKGSVGMSLYYSDVTDLINDTTKTIDGDDGPENWEYTDNIGKASLKGLELSYGTMYFDKHDIQVVYAYTDAKNESPERTSDFISSVPIHQLRISDRIIFNDKLSLYAKARYEKGQKEDIGWDEPQWIEMDDYWVFDLKGSFNYNEYVQVSLSIQNIFDENYSTSYGFPREGRTFVFGMKANF